MSTTAAPAAAFLPHLLFALLVVVVAAKVCGWLFKRLKQPPVIGEVIAGILLGPSVLGYFFPGAATFLMPTSIAPTMNAVAQIGVVIFMFLVGIELDLTLLRNRIKASVAISHASIALPFALGGILSLYLYNSFAPPGTSPLSFGLFMGVAMSITAFPVLARILTDLKMSRSPIGAVALASAAVDDATAWCLLALVIGVTQSDASQALITLTLALLFSGFMLTVGRTAVAKLVARVEQDGFDQGVVVIAIAGVLTAALITELIGIHALFGPFLLGALIPADSRLAHELTARIENLVMILLLPMFFAYTGMRTQIGLLNSTSLWMWCFVIIAIASVGKIGGAFTAARMTGSSWREAAALGFLMNTRGLMELIVLNIGLDLGLLSPQLFAMMVIMAVVTTMMTSPLFQLCMGRTALATAPASALSGAGQSAAISVRSSS